MYNHVRHFSQTPYPRLQEKIFAAVKHIKTEQDRSPTIQELALQTGASNEWVLEAMEYNLNSSQFQYVPKPFSVH
jgi:hypothetical protein